MIPVSLELEDFLSYAHPGVISFEGIDVLCLSGANGQGKSSLLDAMTWAMFGAARGCEGGQHQDRLIREGADDARVTFVFELSGDRYRIQRSRTRSGKAELRFEIESADGWTNLAADTLRETEQRIASVLRMDHRTFTASAFFLQGRADDFLSRMKPEERKEVFASLLDLGTYEKLTDASRAHAREAEARRRAHAERIEDLKGRVADLEAAKAAHAELAARVDELAAAAAEAEEELEAAREAQAETDKAAALARAEAEAKARLEKQISELEASVASGEKERATLSALLDREDECTRAVEEAERLRAEDEALQRATVQLGELERQRAEASGRLEGARKELEADLRGRRERLAVVETELTALEELVAQAEALASRVVDIPAIGSSIEDLRRELVRRREDHATLGAELNALAARQQAIGERLTMIDRGDGVCPVCGEALDADHARRLRGELTAERAELDRLVEVTTARREDVEKEGTRLKEEEQRLAATVAELQREAERLAQVQGRLAERPRLLAEREETRARIEAGERALSDGTVGQEHARAIATIEARVGELHLDPDRHAVVRARLKELAPFAELRGRIEQARERCVGVDAELARHRASLVAARAELADRPEVDAEGAVARARRAAEAVQRFQGTASAAREKATEARTAAAAAAERVAAGERDVAELEKVRAAERAEADDARRYGRLAQAFGRGGIPDRIIENALPELTQDANDILGRLTDHEMSVSFRMDKLTRSGSVRETFEVLVHHDGGVRDFQMFSGGEAFRIAFAIRLGLSKLLVRRAGARLETLVIDEGFGTQDPEGRERLVEAINIARREFRKVIVITHLDELKDAFDAQFRVTKHAVHGSQVELLGG